MHGRLGRALTSFQQWMDVDNALEHYRATVEALSGQEERASLGYAYVGIAGASLWGVRTQEGLEAGERAVEIANRLGHEVLWANAAAIYGWHVWASGRPAEGQALLEQAYEVADRLEHGDAAFFAAWMRGFTSLMLGDPMDARMWLDRELAKPRVAQAPNLRMQLLQGVTQACMYLCDSDERDKAIAEMGDSWGFVALETALRDGDPDTLFPIRERGLAETRKRGNRFMHAGNLQMGAHLHRLYGNFEEATSANLEALSIVAGNLPYETWQRCWAIESLCRLGRLDEAHEHLQRVTEYGVGGEGWRGEGALLERAKALIAAAESRFDDADQHFASADEITRRYSYLMYRAEVLDEWGRFLAIAGDPGRANEKLDEAAQIYRRGRFGQPWLDRIEASRPK
jgi:tetratricopeptide (TPR) repeat protein